MSPGTAPGFPSAVGGCDLARVVQRQASSEDNTVRRLS